MWVLTGLLLAVALAAAVVSVLLHRIEPFLRARIVEALEDRFHARVELDGFHVSLVGGLWVEGKGLSIWPPAQVEGVTVPGTAEPARPLIALEEFRFHAPLLYQPGKPLHISEVQLRGLNLNLPPRSHFEHPSAAVPKSGGEHSFSFLVDQMECSGARVVLGTSNPAELPLDFEIAHFTLTNVSSGGPMGFDAELTNPRPVGTIHSAGSFGPWQASDPARAPSPVTTALTTPIFLPSRESLVFSPRTAIIPAPCGNSLPTETPMCRSSA